MQPKGETLRQSQVWEGPGGMHFELATSANLIAPALKTLFAYWAAKCAGRFAPTREDIDPKDIPAILPNIHMHDVLDAGKAFRVRLLGTQIVAAVGEDQTQRTFTETDDDLLGARMFVVQRAVMEQRRPIRSTARHTAARHLDFLSAESLCMPLSQDGVSVDKLLACTIFSQPRSLL
jgi:hypothetical protein